MTSSNNNNPIVIAEIALGQEILKIEIKEWRGRRIFSAWRFWRDKANKLRPGRHGIAFAVDRLPDVARAFAAAVEKARNLGLTTDDAE